MKWGTDAEMLSEGLPLLVAGLEAAMRLKSAFQLGPRAFARASGLSDDAVTLAYEMGQRVGCVRQRKGRPWAVDSNCLARFLLDLRRLGDAEGVGH